MACSTISAQFRVSCLRTELLAVLILSSGGGAEIKDAVRSLDDDDLRPSSLSSTASDCTEKKTAVGASAPTKNHRAYLPRKSHRFVKMTGERQVPATHVPKYTEGPSDKKRGPIP
mmetsp:Transcript_20050/g.27194  ORF Transcript_20050/g.27194 Transcript_20050/m.27194 type:complete len:115 (+) Transcript_20050:757-1101(+)